MTDELKRYLSDGVYADYDGCHIILTTSDGISTTNEICLDASVERAFCQYIRDLQKMREQAWREANPPERPL